MPPKKALMQLMVRVSSCIVYFIYTLIMTTDISLAIIYQCIRVISKSPVNLVRELISEGQDLFGSIKKFATAQNHIMKYLGLRCLALMNEEFWDEQLRDGVIISDAIAVSRGDETLANEVTYYFSFETVISNAYDVI